MKPLPTPFTTLEIIDTQAAIRDLPYEVFEGLPLFSELLSENEELENTNHELSADNEELKEAMWSHFQYLLDEIPTEREKLDRDDLEETVAFLETKLIELYKQYSE